MAHLVMRNLYASVIGEETTANWKLISPMQNCPEDI